MCHGVPGVARYAQVCSVAGVLTQTHLEQGSCPNASDQEVLGSLSRADKLTWAKRSSVLRALYCTFPTTGVQESQHCAVMWFVYNAITIVMSTLEPMRCEILASFAQTSNADNVWIPLIFQYVIFTSVHLAPVFGQLSCQSAVHLMLDHKMLKKPSIHT